MTLVPQRSTLEGALIPHRPTEDDPKWEIRAGALIAGAIAFLLRRNESPLA